MFQHSLSLIETIFAADSLLVASVLPPRWRYRRTDATAPTTKPRSFLCYQASASLSPPHPLMVLCQIPLPGAAAPLCDLTNFFVRAAHRLSSTIKL